MDDTSEPSSSDEATEQSQSTVWPPPPKGHSEQVNTYEFRPGNGRLLVAGVCLSMVLLTFDNADAILQDVNPYFINTSFSTTAYLVNTSDIAVLFMTGAIFSLWFYRSYRNIAVFGLQERLNSPEWALIHHFLPILGLYRPYQTMSDLWKSSDPSQLSREGTSWKDAKGTWQIAAWWGSWIVASASYLGQLYTQPNRLNGPDIVLQILQAAFGIASGVCLISLVLAIDRRQTQKESLINQMQRNK